MTKDELARVAQGRVGEDARNEMVQAGANVSRYAVDAGNVTPFYPWTEADRRIMALEGARRQ